MTIPDEPSNREIDLAALGSSDESVEELLSGGADIDALIAAGVLDDREREAEVDEDEEAKLNADVEADMAQIEAEVSALSTEEVMAQIQASTEWFEANGHGSRPIRI
jgi:hypothetical protein